ncbi:MAG: hypothetical protein MHPSP_000032 [Paramarteilia canceri]
MSGFQENIISDLIFVKQKCKLMIKNSTSTEKKKYPGVCIIKSDHILFHNEEKFIEPLKLNILEILEYSINKPSSPTTQSTVKITTINNIYVFYGWPQAVQRFMYSYVTREIHLARPMSEDINKENCEGFNNKFSASRDNLFKLDQSSGSSLDSGGIDQICNILLSKLKCDNMMVYSGKFDLTVQQLFNLTLEDNMFTKEFRESTGEKEIEHLPWHVDVDGQMVSDSSFKSIVKPFSKEIVTNLRSTITWPSVEGKLYTVHTTSTSSKISMVNSIIVSSYLVMNANPDMESVSLNVFTSIEIKGSAVPHLIIKKSIISMMKSRYNKLEERIKNSLSELKQNLMYNNLDYLPNFHKSLSSNYKFIKSLKINFFSKTIE